MRGRAGAAAALVTGALLAGACGGAGPASEAGLRRVLEEERQAHLTADAARLVAHLADSLVVVDGGSVFVQARADVEAMFRDYFAGASYAAWDDLEEPRVRIADDGSMAWVARRVGVDRSAPGFGGRTRRDRFESAWVATYEASGDAWSMTSVTSTFVQEPEAARILAGARRSLGGEGAVAAARFTRFEADVSGPGDDFRVIVASSAAGAVRIDFSTGFSAGIAADEAWMRSTTVTGTQPLSDTLETFVRGHDLLMNALRPEGQYGPLRFGGAEPYAGVAALRLDGMDVLGTPVAFYYASADTVPLGFRVIDNLRGGGPVTARLLSWRPMGDLRLPRRARFEQGSEVFEYELVDLEVSDSVPAGAFTAEGSDGGR